MSYTNIRKEEYKIQTIIFNDWVEKTAYSEKTNEHINEISRNIGIMNKKNIKTLDKIENGRIVSRFIKNSPSYDEILIDLLKEAKNDEFFESIQNYKDNLLEKLERVEFKQIKNNNIFDKYNIEYTEEIVQNMNFVKYGLWDLIFHNAFYINEELYFYDQEWFEYNIPIEFIIYRAIAYFPIAHSFIKTEELYKRLGLENYLKVFQELDGKLQEKIRDKNIWEKHLRTQTGQTLLNLYNNLIDEFNEYKKKYNQNIVDENEKVIVENKKIINENTELNGKNRELENRVNELEKKIEKIYNSTSWKITGPMRWIKKNINVKRLGGKQ